MFKWDKNEQTLKVGLGWLIIVGFVAVAFVALFISSM